jgi:anti-sigma regulatory factor (Ser/Thr protein kinase)
MTCRPGTVDADTLRRGGVPAEPGSGAGPAATSLELAALPGAVPCARGHVRAVARERGLEDLADDAELISSELVTNATRASARLTTPEQPVVRMWIASNHKSIMISVWDGSGDMPVRQHPGYDDDSGRGLVIVHALAARWGCYPVAAGGKITWAELSR